MWEPPANWRSMIANIRKVREKFPAPVDSMGCDQCHDKNEKTTDQRFQILLSLMLSSQTKDPITWAAVQKLKDNGLANPKNLMNAKEKDIEDLIHPVGFYRRKAIYLKKVANIIDQEYGGDIPTSVDALCKLPGVGPKMAHLCMQEAWDVNSGIGVDVHVHRISARLGWVPEKGIKTPEDTRKTLEKWLPPEYWKEINRLLVGFGQTICSPLRPRCDECFNESICPKIGVVSKKKAPAKNNIKLEIVAEQETSPVKIKSEASPNRRTLTRKVKEEPEPIIVKKIKKEKNDPDDTVKDEDVPKRPRRKLKK